MGGSLHSAVGARSADDPTFQGSFVVPEAMMGKNGASIDPPRGFAITMKISGTFFAGHLGGPSGESPEEIVRAREVVTLLGASRLLSRPGTIRATDLRSSTNYL